MEIWHFLQNVLKRRSFQKYCAGIWSLLYYQETWYFFFLKIWSYSLDGKWYHLSEKNTVKMVFLFLANMILPLSKEHSLSFPVKCSERWHSRYYWKRWYLSKKKRYFFSNIILLEFSKLNTILWSIFFDELWEKLDKENLIIANLNHKMDKEMVTSEFK